MDTYMCIAEGTYVLYCPDVLFECYDMFVQDLAVLDDNIWWKTHSINHIADCVYFELHDCIYGYWYMYFCKILLKSFFIIYSPVPSLPTTNGLPPTRSPRPYTTFELDQIRQHAKRYFLLSITRLGCGQISLYC